MFSTDLSGRAHSDSESLDYRKDRIMASTSAKLHATSKSHSKLCCNTSFCVSYEEKIGDAENKIKESYSAKPNLDCGGDVNRLKPSKALLCKKYACKSEGASSAVRKGNTEEPGCSQKDVSRSFCLQETPRSISETNTRATNSCTSHVKYPQRQYNVSSGGGVRKEGIALVKIQAKDATTGNILSPKAESINELSLNCCQLKKNEEQNSSRALPNKAKPCSGEAKQEFKTEGTETKAILSDEATERKVLDAYVLEVIKTLAWKESQRKENIEHCISRPGKTFFTKLDSSLKKNTAFVKKVKSFSSEHLDVLLNDLSRLNLAKYLSEVATALVQAKLKVLDITPAVKLSNALHHLYADFSMYLFQSLQKLLPLKDEVQLTGQKLLNVDLKLYVELISIGILPYDEAFLILISVLSKIINNDKQEYNHICVLVSFYRYCTEGYSSPRKFQALAKKYDITLPTQMLLLPKDTDTLKYLVKDYFDGLVDHVFKERNELFIFQQQNKRILQTRGELSSDRKLNWDTLRSSYENLLSGMNMLAKVLGEDAPTFNTNFTLSDMKIVGSNDSDQQTTFTIWEDAEEQQFYENLTDMSKYAATITGHNRLNKPVPGNHYNHSEDLCGNSDGSHTEDTSDFSDEEKKEYHDHAKCNDREISSFLFSLQGCLNCEMVDKLAIAFLTTFYNKVNLKRLLKVLFYVPRTRIDLLPFYARLVATLNPVIPLLAKDLAKKLKKEFKYRVQKKDQINIESKLKVVKYIGEIVKFKIFSKFDALRCLKMLLNDFSHHHIEMCCAFLESCGRFLLRNPESREATNFFLEGMMRKKAVTPLESRYLTMIENAYYYVSPPEVPSTENVVLSPLQQFIQHLLFQKLSKNTADEILTLLCKVDWEDTEICEFIVNCLSAPRLVKYNNISCLASLVAGLTCYEDDITVSVIDAVMEDIRLGMEINIPMYNQSRLATIKYLGELFKYGVIDTADIFKVLYSLISFGVYLSYPNTSTLDPPSNLFRIRMTCLLLETCGQYFRGSITKRRLEYYLKYFQRYFLFKYEDSHWQTPKNPFPVGIRYLFLDTLQTLQPQIHLFVSYREACDAVKKMEEEVVSELPSNVATVLYSDLQANSDMVASHLLAQLASLESLCNETEGEMQEQNDNHENTASALSNVVAEECVEDVQEPSQKKTTQQVPECMKSVSTEDEQFMSEFNKMVQENMQQHLLEAVKPKHIDIAIPLHHKTSMKKSWEQMKGRFPKEQETFDITLLLRRGHKQDYKQINIPSNSELALKLKRGEEEERAEKEKLKKLILDMNQRQEEEDYQELLSQSQQTVALSIKKRKKVS